MTYQTLISPSTVPSQEGIPETDSPTKSLWISYPECLRGMLEITDQDVIDASTEMRIEPNYELFKKTGFKERLAMVCYWLWHKEQEHLIKYGGRIDGKQKRFNGDIDGCSERILYNNNN